MEMATGAEAVTVHLRVVLLRRPGHPMGGHLHLPVHPMEGHLHLPVSPDQTSLQKWVPGQRAVPGEVAAAVIVEEATAAAAAEAAVSAVVAEAGAAAAAVALAAAAEVVVVEAGDVNKVSRDHPIIYFKGISEALISRTQTYFPFRFSNRLI